MHLPPEDNNLKEGTKRTLNSSKQLLWGIPGPAWAQLRADSSHQVPCLDEKMERCAQVLIQVVIGRCYIEPTDKGLGNLAINPLRAVSTSVFSTFFWHFWDPAGTHRSGTPCPLLNLSSPHSAVILQLTSPLTTTSARTQWQETMQWLSKDVACIHQSIPATWLGIGAPRCQHSQIKCGKIQSMYLTSHRSMWDIVWFRFFVFFSLNLCKVFYLSLYLISTFWI